MAEERDGMDSREPPEEYREFRRMMDRLGHEDLRRMIEGLTEKIRANPGDTGPLFLRGLVHRDLGDLEQALSDFNAAVDLEPNHGLARYARGITKPQPGPIRPCPPGLRCRPRPGPGQRRRAARQRSRPGQPGP